MIGAMLASLMLLSVLTAVGPACLLATTFGMTMPMSSGQDSSGACGSADGSSISVCPYSAPQDVASNSARITTPDVFDVVSESGTTPEVIVSAVPRALADDRESPPPAHLVPLRI